MNTQQIQDAKNNTFSAIQMQISERVCGYFKGIDTMETLERRYCLSVEDLEKRISEFKRSAIWTDEEKEKIEKFTFDRLRAEAKAAKTAIVLQMRKEYIF